MGRLWLTKGPAPRTVASLPGIGYEGLGWPSEQVVRRWRDLLIIRRPCDTARWSQKVGGTPASFSAALEPRSGCPITPPCSSENGILRDRELHTAPDLL
jgi:hypothetical protein